MIKELKENNDFNEAFFVFSNNFRYAFWNNTYSDNPIYPFGNDLKIVYRISIKKND